MWGPRQTLRVNCREEVGSIIGPNTGWLVSKCFQKGAVKEVISEICKMKEGTELFDGWNPIHPIPKQPPEMVKKPGK